MAGPQLSREARNAQTKQRNANRKAANLKKEESRKKLDPLTQLKKLNDRLGKNVGAKLERARLAKKISAAIVV